MPRVHRVPVWALALALLAAVVSGSALSATDISKLPLKASVLAKPNVVFALDDSGSTDFELQINGTKDGLVWSNPNSTTLFPSGQPRSGTNTGDESMYYLFPNGFATGSRNYQDYAADWGVVVPPIPAMAWTRSPSYNSIYYDTTKTYQPWSPAYISGTGLVSFANATPSAARSHPLLGSGTMNLTANVNVDQSNWRFSYWPGLTIPSGAYNVNCWTGGASPGSTVSTFNMSCTSALSYYPATFWHRQSCAVNGTSCVTNFDGQTLQRYEIKSGNSFPSGRSYADEIQNFANWFTYHRKRKLVLAAGLGQVLEDLTNMRLGVVPFNNLSPPTMMDADAAAPSANGLAVAGQFYRIDQPAGTPTHATMAYVYDQFDTNTSIIQYACQRNAMFIITDGYASDGPLNPPSYTSSTYGATRPYQSIVAGSMADKALAYFTRQLRGSVSPLAAGRVPLGDQTVKNPDPNTNLHLNTYGLTLGARGHLWPGITDPFATWPTWPGTIAVGDPAQLDDLWHATINGRGQMYLATEAASTSAAIRAGLNEIAGRTGSQSGVGVSSVNLYRSDGMAYLSAYNTAGWTGDLSASALDPATGGVSSTVSWSAAQLLDARTWSTRVIASHNGSSGVGFNSAGVGSRLNPGNAYGTTANLVDYFRGNRSLEGSTYRSRQSLIGAVVNAEPVTDRGNGVVYLASGDGMLHAFDTRDNPGSELWAYAPGQGLAALGASSQRAWQFNPLLSGTPVIGRGDASTQLLVGGLGSAGRGFYALDVTNPRGLSEGQLATKVKWEFPATGDTTTQGKMGLAMGKPVFARLPAGDYVVLLSSGYNSTADGKGRLWMLNAMTGALIHEFSTSDGSLASEAGLAQVSAFISGDGSSTYAYGGDLLGNLWRFDLVGRGAPVKVAQLRDASNNAQPVTAAPDLMQYSGKRIVLIGTGRLLGETDLGSNRVQTFYAIADGATLANARSSLVAQTYSAGTDTMTTNSVDWTTQRGWYFDLPSGQHANTKPAVAYGAVAFTVNQAGGSDCSAGSYLYMVDVRSGQRLAGATSVRGTLSTSVNSSAATVVLTKDGPVAVGQTEDKRTFQKAIPNANAITSSKNAWREIRR